MIWSIAVTVRLPGARTAPVSRTFTCCQTGREKTGTKTPMTLLKAIGKESMASLSGRREHEFHCRSIVTQIPINEKSQAESLAENFRFFFLIFKAAFWRYRKAGLGRGESLLSIRLILLS